MHPWHARQFFRYNRACLAYIALCAVCEANGANRQAAGLALHTFMEFHNFQGTTANIAKQPISTGKTQQHAIGGNPRFFIPCQDMDRHARQSFTKC